jgi:hypothetical protein
MMTRVWRLTLPSNFNENLSTCWMVRHHILTLTPPELSNNHPLIANRDIKLDEIEIFDNRADFIKSCLYWPVPPSS